MWVRAMLKQTSHRPDITVCQSPVKSRGRGYWIPAIRVRAMHEHLLDESVVSLLDSEREGSTGIRVRT